VTLLLAQPPDGALDQSVQLICSAVDGLVNSCGLVSDRDGLAALDSGFHQATHFAMAALLVAVLIAQMDLHSRDLIAESAQGALHNATELIGQRLATFNIVIGVDLDLHRILFQ
jgi:hypothetical protein